MKKTKILICLGISTIVASASPYVGLQLLGGFIKNEAHLKGFHKNDSTGAMDLFSLSKNANFNRFGFGLFGGYAHQMNEKLAIMGEVDVHFGSKTKTIQFDTQSLNSTATHANENASVKMPFGFGFMPAVSYQIRSNLSGILGLRFSANRFEVKAYHVNVLKGNPNGQILADNTKTEKKFLFGFEPTVGLKYDFSEKVSGRILAGYRFGSRKTMVDNYLNDTAMKNEKAAISGSSTIQEPTASVSINPQGLTVRGTVSYSF